MVRPKKTESREDFVGRCMIDEYMNEKLPQSEARRTHCERIWEEYGPDSRWGEENVRIN